MVSSTDAHSKQRARSYNNLKQAQSEAAETNGYDSLQTRIRLTELFREKFNNDPHEWQLDTTEAILLGLDSLVIAGTGAGKTMPFMLPLLLDPTRKVIIISPLKTLQNDQVERFEKAGIRAAAVNGETWNEKLKEELENGYYQAIFVSPEMCLQHSGFRHILSSSNFKDICAIIVDEAHCISQWGGEFREDYAKLKDLRGFVGPLIPVLATSATLNPAAIKEVKMSLGLNTDDGFLLNLGNDRPNITYMAREAKSAKDIDAIRPHLFDTPDPTTPNDLTKTIIFVNDRLSAQKVARAIEEWLPPHLREYVDFVHAMRSPADNLDVMRCFKQGKVMVLVATETAGMGADIPDVVRIIQLGVPSSLSVWLQRAGRAGRSRHIQAEALLLYEHSVVAKPKSKKSKRVDEEEDAVEGDAEEDDDELKRMKKVEPALLKSVEAAICRRDIVDEHFGNPPNRASPTGACCDNCDGYPLSCRPSTPTHESLTQSPHSTPSKSADENGKRKRQTKQAQTAESTKATSSKKHRDEIHEALNSWRYNMVLRRLSPCPFTAEGFLPTNVLKAITSAPQVTNLCELEPKVKWVFAAEYGDEVLGIIRRIDERYLAAEEAKRQEEEERRILKEIEERKKEEARKEKAMTKWLKEIDAQKRKAERVAKQQQNLDNRRVQADENALQKATKRVEKESKRGRVPLEGLMVMNFGPSTPQDPFLATPTMTANSTNSQPMTSPMGAILDFSQPHATPVPLRRGKHISTPATSATPQIQHRHCPTPLQSATLAPLKPSPSTPSTSTTPQSRPRPRPRPRPLKPTGPTPNPSQST